MPYMFIDQAKSQLRFELDKIRFHFNYSCPKTRKWTVYFKNVTQLYERWPAIVPHFHFVMLSESFDHLLQLLKETKSGKEWLRDPDEPGMPAHTIPAEHRLLMALHYFATVDSNVSIASQWVAQYTHTMLINLYHGCSLRAGCPLWLNEVSQKG